MSDIKYKFMEDVYYEEVRKYIDSTYGKHYAGTEGDLQTFELISKDKLRGYHFSIGSIQKYSDRPTKGQVRSDLLKIIHYGVLALYCHDKMNEKEPNDK